MKKLFYGFAAILIFSAAGYCQLGSNNAGFHYLTSYNGWTFQTGKFEVRAKILTMSSLVNAFCLLHDEAGGDAWSELDFEILGNKPKELQTCAHIFNNSSASQRPQVWVIHPASYDLGAEYHTWTYEWTPSSLTWKLDDKIIRHAVEEGNQVHDVTYSLDNFTDVFTDRTYEPNWLMEYRSRPMRFAFDTWVGYEDFGGPWDPNLPGHAVFFSWFKRYDYTPDEGPGGSDWTLADWDDFDGEGTDFDDRWAEHYRVLMDNGKAVAYFGDIPWNGVRYEDAADTGIDPTALGYIGPRAVRKNFDLNIKGDRITYNLTAPCKVSLSLRDLSGRLVTVLSDAYMAAGSHELTLERNNLAPGAYIVSMQTPAGRSAQRMFRIN